MTAIKYAKFGKCIINMGYLNCCGEPYVLKFEDINLILRYEDKGDGDFGKLTLEQMAKE